MMRIEELIQQLIDTFADRAPSQSADLRLVVSDFDLDLPVEARIANDGTVLMTVPRGLLATGFTLPISRLRLHCEEPSA